MHSLSQQSKAGSEYGEGFLQLRMTGETTHLDVDTLNERLQVQGAERMRHHMCPDEAFGMVFNLDNVIANTKKRQQAAWHRLAQLEGLPPPKPDRPLFDLRPERVITEVLQWTRDWGWARQLAWKMAGLYVEEFREIREPLHGVREWLAALARCNIPCAVVSSMDRASTRQALEQMQLWDYFQVQVTAEDGMETPAQCFLSAALKLGRPPNKCVVFESSPAGVTAAHNCTMKAVAIQGAHPAYRLKQADVTCSNMMELSVYNLRRLFANRGNEFMDVDKMFTGERPPTARWPRISSAMADP
ncbi:hypothetical protein WJX84_001269 [Apatococcus fuscideae]|uniref:Uncharacterized protein n=1 Tax=Apatococcus fuscideae TaxID=2026836 RepID=A0AAW1RRT3_9CHLO